MEKSPWTHVVTFQSEAQYMSEAELSRLLGPKGEQWIERAIAPNEKIRVLATFEGNAALLAEQYEGTVTRA